ncbi:MAG: peptidoglycan DD-metalloendopeptidase family protein [Betaproteobacteria bacterium]|nr:peptidoglycan DD-metalloendopeptidase family protein [Betaproteobacteria bacterium]
MNIILVSSNSTRTKSLTLDWRHAAGVVFALLGLLLIFAVAFNYLTLRYAAAINHPWINAIILADRRVEAERNQQYLQDHLNHMALRVGELQAQIMRLDGLGERLAVLAGLKPQEVPPPKPGRGGAISSLPSQAFTLDEFRGELQALVGRVEERSDQLAVLEALLVQDSAKRKFLPSLAPVDAIWNSSSFGYRIDPFNGHKTFHEGIDFVAEPGTTILAAASGSVTLAESHAEYGKMIEIDHGNGLVSRYAHASKLLVKAGELVVRGQKIAEVGTTGRSTGPHLHFEVRLNGKPQNPTRFLQMG